MDAIIRESAAEYPAILLACGRTANDFRRAFRRGAAGYHNISANNLAPMELLRDEALDGYAVMRLTREQTTTVKGKAEKLFARDRLIDDPSGAIWLEVIHAHLAGEREAHLDLLLNLRDRGRVLNAADRAAYQIKPYPTSSELGDLPSNDAVLPFAARQYLFYRDKTDRYEQWRSLMTTPVRMLTAYLDNGSMMAARLCRGDEPSGHEHRRHFQARVTRIDVELGAQLEGWAAQWNGKRPEAL
ncbi:hypothetical protein [Sphingobium sp.]|uniref:hypothetical protein n=1 Tax=Sphingobium sp. TaxID=1912891 RepID=UPI0025F0F59F|nr:hypothetical protein [Sphingobium sp.]